MQPQEKIIFKQPGKGVYFVEVMADGKHLMGKVILQ
jgi:hypothetical protein